jgi:transposase-like protein
VPPSKYDPKYCKVVLEEMDHGASIPEVCRKIGIGKTTFYNWRHQHEEFASAALAGIELSLGWWMEQGRIHIKDKTFNTALYYINMKNRHGWNDQKVTYSRKEIKGFEGAVKRKMAAIDKALGSGIVSTDEHHMLMDTLLAEVKINEQESLLDRVAKIENQLCGK